MKYSRCDVILIDGMNICIKEAFSPRNLRYRGRGVDVVYGFFRLLERVLDDNPGAICVVAWDGGSHRRVAESKKGVSDGIIPEYYKENREQQKSQKVMDIMESAFEQIEDVENILKLTAVSQVRVNGFEGDDIINTYSRYFDELGKTVLIVSTDKDFYQCLSDNISICTPSFEQYNKSRFMDDFGFDPSLWVDKGALEGETKSSGDNIFGAPGFGDVYSTRYVKEYGDLESIISAIQSKPEKTPREISLIANVDRVRLARSLKRMDVIGGLPDASRVSPGQESLGLLKDSFFNLGLIDLANGCEVLI